MFPLVPSLAGHEEEGEEKVRWSRLYTQISQKLTTLKKVKEEHQILISSEDGETHEKVKKYTDRYCSKGGGVDTPFT